MSAITDLIKKKLDDMSEGKASGSVSVEVSDSDEALGDAFDMFRQAIKSGDTKAGIKAFRMMYQIACSDEDDDMGMDDDDQSDDDDMEE